MEPHAITCPARINRNDDCLCGYVATGIAPVQDDDAEAAAAEMLLPFLSDDMTFTSARELVSEIASRLSPSTAVLRSALEAADKRLCELTPNFPPDVGPDMRDVAEIEETGHVVMQIRAALARKPD